MNSIVRPIPSIVPRWCSSKRDLKTGNSKGQETTAPPVIEVFKSLLSIALLDARYIHFKFILNKQNSLVCVSGYVGYCIETDSFLSNIA